MTPQFRTDWMTALTRDQSVPDGIVRVGFTLILRLNRKTDRCDPSIAQIATDSGRSERSVARDLAELEVRGWIGRNSTRGRYRNSYSFHIPATLTGLTGFNPDMAGRVEVANPDKTGRSTLTKRVGQPCHTVTDHKPGKEPGNRTREEEYTLSNHDSDLFADSPHRQTQKKPPVPSHHRSATESTSQNGRTRKKTESNSELDSAFTEFWNAYPKKAGKPDARKAFDQAIRSGKVTPEGLIAGAERYAAAKAGTEAKYIKHPGGWIRDERWNDEPDDHQPNRSDGTGAASAIAGVFDALSDKKWRQ